MFNFRSACGRYLLHAYVISAPFCVTQAAVASAADTFVRASAVQMARNGDAAGALSRLRILLRDTPADPALRADTVIVANWAGQDTYALEVFAEAVTPHDNADVLEAAARSARNLKRYGEAARLFAEATTHSPSHWQARLGLAMSLAESGQSADAKKAADALIAEHPHDREALLASAYANRLSGHSVDALAQYQLVQRRWPEDREAENGIRASLEQLHATQALLITSPTHANADRATTDAVAETIRFSTYQSDAPKDPRAAARAALAAADDNLARLPANDSEQRLRARMDRLLALRNLERMREVVDEARNLQQQGAILPTYVEIALADAWLYLHEPKRAIPLYREAMAAQPDDNQIAFSLMYAYLEAEDFSAARQLVDMLIAHNPPWLTAPGLRTPQPNPDRSRADLSLALLLGYGDDLAAAQARLQALLAEAPANAEFHRELAGIYLRRGWPRRAFDEYAIAASLDPEDLKTRIEAIGALRSLHQYARADSSLQDLENAAPDNPSLRRARTDWDAERGWQFDVETHQGHGMSPQFGNNDHATQATLASPLFGDAWRVYATGLIESAQVPEGAADYRRAGLGVRYTQGALDVRLAVVQDSGNSFDRSALEGSLRWQFDDAWWAAVEASGDAADIPLRARRYGIYASDAVLAAGWRRDELTAATVHLAYYDFSDGNRRESADLAATQRLWTTPQFKLEGTFEIAASQNSLSGVPYYNPSNDAIVLGGVQADWLCWRDYGRTLHQRFGISVGQYWEQNYGTSPAVRLFYEHEWQWSPHWSLRYGIAWNRQDYDGSRESRSELYAGLHWGGMP